MTPQEYESSGLKDINCRFVFSDGSSVVGLVSNYFKEEPGDYYLVYPSDVIEFEYRRCIRDFDKMKTLCRQIDLGAVSSVEKY